MRKRWKWLAALLLVTAVLAVLLDPTYVLWGLLTGESFYKGRPTSFWSKEIRRWDSLDLLPEPDPAKDRHPFTVLAADEAAQPVLWELLRDPAPFVRHRAALELYPRVSGQQLTTASAAARKAVLIRVLSEALLDSDKPFLRWEAARGLQECGHEAETAIPSLIQAINDRASVFPIPEGPTVADAAAEALVSFGATAVPALVESLQDPTYRDAVAITLAKIGPDARSAVAPLSKAVQHDDLFRYRAAYALWEIDRHNDLSLPTLMKGLRSEHAADRTEAAWHLGYLRSAGSPAVAMLLERLRDDSDKVREGAASALAKIGPGKEAVLTLRAILHERIVEKPVAADSVPSAPPIDERICQQVIRALGSLGPDAKEALPELTAVRKDRWLGAPAADAIERIKGAGPQIRPWSKFIGALVRASDPQESPEFWQALQQTMAVVDPTEAEPGSEPDREALRTGLTHPEMHIRLAAAFALGRIGATRKETDAAIPALSALVKRDPAPEVRFYAAYALGSLHPNGEAVPVFAHALSDKNRYVRQAAIWGLGRAGGEASSAVPALRAALRDPLASLCVPPYGGLDLERPIDCRKRVPGTGEDLTQYLPEELRPTRDDTLPERIIHLLATFGPDAKDALPELQAGLEDPLTGVRREAARAIEAITKRRER